MVVFTFFSLLLNESKSKVKFYKSDQSISNLKSFSWKVIKKDSGKLLDIGTIEWLLCMSLSYLWCIVIK